MYRRKQYKKQKKNPSEHSRPRYNRNSDKQDFNYNKVRSLSKNSKLNRLSQIDKELADIVFEPEYRIGDKYDQLLLERWQLRYDLGL